MEGSSSSLIYFFFFFLLSISAAPTTSTEFIRTSCSSTTYPTLCFSSLSKHASLIQTNPKVLASTSLHITLSTTRSTSSMMLKLSRTHGMNPRQVGAMKDCVEELSDSVEELRRSMDEMSHPGSKNFGVVMSDVQTWVSSALTDETTCFDGFDGNMMNGNLKNTVKSHIMNVAHLTSNALALINQYAALHGGSYVTHT